MSTSSLQSRRFLDADVIIDLLRGYEPAVDWFDSLEASGSLSIPGHALMELIQGTSNRQQLRHLLEITSHWPVYWLSPEDCSQALQNLIQYHLAYRLGALDALIAQSAIAAGAVLCTFNIKHFRVLSDLVTEQPYPRGIAPSV